MNSTLIDKLDGFIRKYYKNRLLRGLIWSFTGVLSAFIIASLLEYYGRFESANRKILFITFTLFSTVVLIRFFVVPLLKLYKLGKRINYDQAATIIGSHFTDVQDKLLNTLQLSSETSGDQWLQAAVDQKTEELKPVPFQAAIDLRKNLKYLRYAAIPLVSLLIILLVAPGFKDSTTRLVNFEKEYLPEAPFTFKLNNTELVISENEPFTVQAELLGNEIPQEVTLHFNGYSYRMTPLNKFQFEHTINKTNRNINFYIEANGFKSEEYTLKVVQRPSLLAFNAFIDYPAYTGLKDEKINNTTNYVVPVGSQILWKLKSKHVEKLIFKNKSNKENRAQKKDGVFQFVQRFLNSDRLHIRSSNTSISKGDSLTYTVDIIPDEYPIINLEEKKDSLSAKIRYMMGKVSDDYGLSKLLFKYRFTQSDSAQKVSDNYNSIPLTLAQGGKTQSFYYLWDLKEIGVSPNDKIEYFVEVWDNDGVHGAKKSRSTPKTYAAPSAEEINKKTDQKTEELKNDIAKNSKNIEGLEQEMLDLEKQLTERKKLSWEDKKKIKDLLRKHEKMQEDLKNIIEENKQNNAKQEEFSPVEQAIKEKQEQIQKLMEEVMDDEMQKLMDQINELMEKNRKNELLNKLDELNMKDQQINKQLDRMLEQLKQLQLEKKVNETVDKLNKLAEEQKKLSEETKQGDTPKDELIKKQEDLEKKYDETKKDIEDIDKKNKDLEKPLDLDKKEQKEKQEEVSKDQQESKEEINKGKKDKASEKQKNASEKMKEQAQSLQQQMQSAKKKQQMEDYNTLREILENLIQVSKDQEKIMAGFKKIKGYNPKYIELAQQQKKLRDDTRLIEDSLTALSKRVEQVEHFINKEMGLVNNNMKKTMRYLGERQTRRVLIHEQYVMTSLNNLALMLSQSLEQMQEQMKQQSKGSCENPGNNQNSSSPSQGMQSMKKMQEQLKKQLESMQKGMQENGEKPGSQGFGEAAAQQSAIRKKLQEIQKKLDKEGKGGMSNELKKTEDIMDDIEKDLYNKTLNPDVLRKQQEIVTRLLEHEKALREQEKDNKRKSNEGKEIEREIPPSIKEYLKQKEKEQELLKTLPPDLNPYYEQKVRNYFEQLGQ